MSNFPAQSIKLNWRYFKPVAIGFGCSALVCSIPFSLIYLMFNLPLIQGNLDIAQAEKKIAPLYNQLVSIRPQFVNIIYQQPVQSGSYTFSLSDGAQRYAHVWAQIRLQSISPAADVIEAYSSELEAVGAKEVLANKTSAMSFYHFADDEDLLIGICRIGEESSAVDSADYVAFIDFDNGPGCESADSKLGCVINRHCGD